MVFYNTEARSHIELYYTNHLYVSSLQLARSACFRLAGWEHFASALEPLTLKWGMIFEIG